MRCGICLCLVLEWNRNTSRMEWKGIEARGLVLPRACTAESDACMMLELARLSVPNATLHWASVSEIRGQGWQQCTCCHRANIPSLQSKNQKPSARHLLPLLLESHCLDIPNEFAIDHFDKT